MATDVCFEQHLNVAAAYQQHICLALGVPAACMSLWPPQRAALQAVAVQLESNLLSCSALSALIWLPFRKGDHTRFLQQSEHSPGQQ